MSDRAQHGAHTEIQGRLQATLERVSLPDRLRASGQALADRLASPVRLSFMGKPGVGKTTLMQALLGVEVPGLDQNATTYEMTHSETPRAVLTLEDGTRREIAGAGLNAVFQYDPVFVELHLPCERLHSVRMLELVTDGSEEEMSIAAPWAAARCDIPIWCTRDFDAQEMRIWSKIPTDKKNHAMLVLTQADQVPAEHMSEMLEHAFGLDGVGFSLIAPVAARHALRAQIAGRQDAEKMVKASGVGALRQEIFRRIEQGRQLDLDHAEMFLSRFENQKVRNVSVLQPKAKDETQETKPSPGAANAAALLRQQAQSMLIDIQEFGPFAPAKIVERCLEAANALVDLIADEMPVGDAQKLAHSSVSDAADMLLLMTLENTKGAAEDAVNLMLQVKREFEQAA